jgi:Ca2+-binding EF-hand superfamily protein
MDTDSNGKVNIDELKRFESLCVLPDTLRDSEFFTFADANKDGKVSMVEHMETLKKL